MLQTIIILAIFFVIIIPTGKYLYHIAEGKPTFADGFFNPIDNFIFRLGHIDKEEMNWKQYAVAILITNAVMVMIGYFILRIQSIPILNPNRIAGMEPSLSFNTIISFMTNTNLQHYSGESGLTYFSQMTVIIFMMFTSAATGYSAAMAFIIGLAGKRKSLGNFYVNIVRITTRVLVPLSLVIGIILVSQGVPQNLSKNITLLTIEGKYQDIAMGPVAALESIKHLGTNGGGFFGANSSTPFENPNIITNMIEMLSMMLLPGACVIAFGHMVSRPRKNNKKKNSLIGSEAKPIIAVMSLIFIIGILISFRSEVAGNPVLENVGLSQSMGNMEGKETRFGIAQSTLFTTVTTAFTTGSVNNMHDTLTPLGGSVPLMNMMLNVVFGGKGVGLMNMILYAILSVFICGLMIGRTPEYLGKKIEGKEMKLTALGIIVHPLLILAFTALAVSVPAGLAGITNPGHHGLTQVLYEYASSAANNGSGFEGLADNKLFWNVTTGLVMFFGRYLSIVIQLAIAGSLMMKTTANESFGTLKTDTSTFSIFLFMVVMIIAALTFFPVMVLGPIAEHLKL
nr:potassium-transporting ATPase subunit KdpA [Tissierella sp.]